jgi:hypothetical protein
MRVIKSIIVISYPWDRSCSWLQLRLQHGCGKCHNPVAFAAAAILLKMPFVAASCSLRDRFLQIYQPYLAATGCNRFLQVSDDYRQSY